MDAVEVIQCAQLCHSYPNGVQALRNISLSIKKGEYVAFVGQNGSGKTTLVKHFNGLLKPTEGTVSIFGEETTHQKVSALSCKVGYVFQNPDDMLFCSSVAEEIAYGPKMLGYPPEETHRMVERVLAELGLFDLREIHPFALSLGDRQRVAVACALSLHPEIFVFDEPTTGQDYFGGESIMHLIDMLHFQGKTVIIITHDMPLVAEHARRVVVMNQGRVALDGTPEEVFQKVDELRALSLRSPQVTRLAQELGQTEKTILRVNDMYAWLESDYLRGEKVVEGAYQ
ncbi:MAG: ATP-binding cassette domain-containing protein [Anaerolineaceae bacterium]|nr:ATP-binding cassette domain-containing protein [Anaerolineaceae bacterium]